MRGMANNTRDDDTSLNGLAALAGPAWSAVRVFNAFRIDSGALTEMQDAGAVLALATSDGVHVYPVHQFHRRGDFIEVRPALSPLLRALRDFDPWPSPSYFTHPPRNSTGTRRPSPGSSMAGHRIGSRLSLLL